LHIKIILFQSAIMKRG